IQAQRERPLVGKLVPQEFASRSGIERGDGPAVLHRTWLKHCRISVKRVLRLCACVGFPRRAAGELRQPLRPAPSRATGAGAPKPLEHELGLVLIRRPQRARRQAETPLTALFKFPEPALTTVVDGSVLSCCTY